MNASICTAPSNARELAKNAAPFHPFLPVGARTNRPRVWPGTAGQLLKREADIGVDHRDIAGRAGDEQPASDRVDRQRRSVRGSRASVRCRRTARGAVEDIDDVAIGNRDE